MPNQVFTNEFARDFTYTEEFRTKTWNRLQYLENSMALLKDIVKNDMPITDEFLENWNEVRRNISEELNNIYVDLMLNKQKPV